MEGRFAVGERKARVELCAGWEGGRVEEGQKTSRRGRCCEGGRGGVCGERKGVGCVRRLSSRGGCWVVGKRQTKCSQCKTHCNTHCNTHCKTHCNIHCNREKDKLSAEGMRVRGLFTSDGGGSLT